MMPSHAIDESPDAKQQFRNAMAHLSAAVNVITTAGPLGRCGITASAVCSVTDTPPTLLVCLNRSSAMRSIFEGNQRVCVNVLSGEHELLARHFAGMTEVPMEERFKWPIWDDGADGVPVLRDALANLEGEIVDVKEVGSHSIMFIKADRISVRAEGDGLVYFARKFNRVQRLTSQ